LDDPVVRPWFAANAPGVAEIIPLAGFVAVVAAGLWFTRERARTAR